MEKRIEENVITYELRGDYYYPCLTLPEQKHYPTGKYGNLHLAFLKEHRRGTYGQLVGECRLNEYLHDIDILAKEEVDRITTEFAKSRNIDERLKVKDQLRWVAEMNNCKAVAEEIVLKEIIFS